MCSSENDNNLGLPSVHDVPWNYYLSTESSGMTNCGSVTNNKNGFNSNLSRLWYAQQMIAKHDTNESNAISIKRVIVWIGYQSHGERWMDIFAFIPCRSHRILSGLGLKLIFVAKANGKQLEFTKYCKQKTSKGLCCILLISFCNVTGFIFVQCCIYSSPRSPVDEERLDQQFLSRGQVWTEPFLNKLNPEIWKRNAHWWNNLVIRHLHKVGWTESFGMFPDLDTGQLQITAPPRQACKATTNPPMGGSLLTLNPITLDQGGARLVRPPDHLPLLQSLFPD